MSIMELAMAKILILPEAARGPFWVKRVVGHPPATSGLPGTTDIIGTPRLVLFVPKGDIRGWTRCALLPITDIDHYRL